MKLSLALSVFLAAVAQASDDVNSIAQNLARDDAGMLHVGRDGVLRSFTRDLEVIDAAHVTRDEISIVSARDMLNPSDAIMNDVRSLQEFAVKQEKRDLGVEKRSCGSYCSASNGCSMLNEQRCQLCISSKCGG